MRLSCKKAIVTGAANGIGRAIFLRFVEEGAAVVGVDQDEMGLNETISNVTDPNAKVYKYVCDVSSKKSVERMVLQSTELLKGIDIIVNSAAVFEFGGVQDISKDVFDISFETNVVGPSLIVLAALDQLKSSGSAAVVNIASISGFIAQSKSLPYNAAKGALVQLTRCMAMDLGRFNIRANSVCPGDVRTENWFKRGRKTQLESGGRLEEDFESLAADSSALKRVADPREIAHVALFLASDEASYITGASVVVDGGQTI